MNYQIIKLVNVAQWIAAVNRGFIWIPALPTFDYILIKFCQIKFIKFCISLLVWVIPNQVFCISTNSTSLSTFIVFCSISDSILIFSVFSFFIVILLYVSFVFYNSSGKSWSFSISGIMTFLSFSFSTSMVSCFFSFSSCKVSPSFSSFMAFRICFSWLIPFVVLLPVFLLWHKHLRSCWSKLQFIHSQVISFQILVLPFDSHVIGSSLFPS